MTHRLRLGSYTAVLVSILGLAVLLPVLRDAGHGRTWLPQVLFAIVLGACLAAVVDRRRLLVALLLLGAAIQLLEWDVVPLGARAAGHAVPALGALFFGAICVVMLGDVIRAGRITSDKVVGAVVAFLLLGLAWARLHVLVAAVSPGAYVASGVGPTDMTGEQLYFSFVTLTTLGYGDIVPVSGTARALAWLEAVTGQLYVAIVIARLVALHLTGSGGRDPG